MDVTVKGGEVVGEVEVVALRGAIAAVIVLSVTLAARRTVVVAAGLSVTVTATARGTVRSIETVEQTMESCDRYCTL